LGEERKNLDGTHNAFGQASMVGKNVLQRKDGHLDALFKRQELPEGKPLERIDGLPARKIRSRLAELQEGRSAVNDEQVGIKVGNRFDQAGPVREMMDFVEKEVRESVGVEVFDGLQRIVRCKPDVVEGDIDRFVAARPERFPDMLEDERRLAGSFRPLDADEPVVPVDPRTEVATERHGNGTDQPIRGIQKGKNFRVVHTLTFRVCKH
jgi:hypothetical protein